MLYCRCIAGGLVLGALFVASSADAHINVSSPKPRHAQSGLGDPQKTGPCGVGGATDVRGTNVSVYKPGQTIKVEWDETINHPGHFRILFDKDGQNFPDPKSYTDYDAGGDKTLADNIPHAGPKYSVSVTLPNTECTNCTLQVVQVMTDKPPYTVGGNDLYYHCVDMILSNDPDAGSVTPGSDSGTTPGDEDGGTGTGTGTDDGGTGTGTGTGTGGGKDASADGGKSSAKAAGTPDDGGCSITNVTGTGSGAPIGAAVAFGVALAALAARRKR